VVKKIQNAMVMALLLGVSLASAAQQGADRSAPGTGRVYREGNAWVEEITGTLPAARNLRVDSEVGSLRVNGGSCSGLSYVVKKRAFTGSEDAARREFESFRINAARQGDAAVLRGEWTSGRNHRMSAEFVVQAPRDLDLVRLETRGGSIAVNNISGRVEGDTAGGITAEFVGSRGDFTDSSLETTAGDITVYISTNLACSINAAIDMASGHRIRTDFPDIKVTTEGSEYGPKRVDAQGSLNGGGPVLKMRTSVGDIDIRRGH